MTVSSADVAARAGVSRATVSYVLNNTPGQTIPQPTRDAVLRAVRDLGYRPNALARSLRRGRGEVVLCPLPVVEVSHPIATLVQSCSVALADKGLTLITDFTRHTDPARQLDAWLQLSPCAVVDVLLRHDDPVLPKLRVSGIPVMSGAFPDEPGWESSGDAYAREARRSQLSYLLDRGHQQIAHVCPPSLPVDPRAERGMFTELRATARRRQARLSVRRVELHAPSLRRLVATWFTDGLPEAVAAHSDDYAMAIIAALADQGIRVPRDVAVMGIDDVPLGRVFSPPLTTLRADYGRFATALADAVVEMLDGSRPSAPLPVPGADLVVRESA